MLFGLVHNSGAQELIDWWACLSGAAGQNIGVALNDAYGNSTEYRGLTTIKNNYSSPIPFPSPILYNATTSQTVYYNIKISYGAGTGAYYSRNILYALRVGSSI